MNTQSSESVNIYEQRNCLNQLDEEIEKTIRELNSLNSQTMHQARAIQKKISNTRFVSPNQSFSLNAKASPNTSFTDSLDYRDIRNNPKNTKSGQLQLSPGDLIPRDDPLKELGYGSPDHQLMTDPKEYPFQQEPDFNQRVVLAQPFDFRSQNNDPKKQKNLGIVQKSSPPRKQLCRSEANTRESTYNSQAQHKENSILNTSQSRNSLHNLMEYHKLSNLDIPKERIHGQSRPEQFFGHQNNLRRKSGNQLERSPSASSVPSNSVVERLMNYGKQKEERLKMARNGGDLPRRVPYHVPKNAKPKLSKSYMGPDSDGSVFTTPVGSNHIIEHAFEEHSQSVTNFNASLKRNSVGSAEMIKQQIDQAGVGSHSEMNKEDVFYELYKEGYGAIPEVSEMAENATTKGELQNIINNMRDRVQRDQSPSNGEGRGLTKSKSQTKVNYETKVSYGTLTKYKHVEPRYMNPTRDASKSPVAHAETEENPKPLFRPQLSKKSLEIASRLENSFQRLVDTSITKSKENKKKLIKKIDNEHTFQPKINKLSKALDERFKANVFNGDELHRWDQLYLMKEKYNMDREARIRQKEEEEANNKECTFHPQISSNSYRMYRDNSTDFAERAKNWKHNKERRLDKEREYRFDKEMENCTFQPEVTENPNRFRNSSFSGSHNLNDISNLSIRGIDQHFEKIDKANRMKKELEARQERFSGKNWKSQITVPKEFLFHKRGEPYGNYVRENIYGNAGESLEEKISKKVLFMERGRDLSPQAPPPRQRESFNNDSWMGHTNEFTMQQNTFEDAVVRLHYELQRMEF